MEDFNMSTPIEILKEIAAKHGSGGKQAKWIGSTFEAIKKMPTSNKGNVGEEFVVELAKTIIDKNAHANPDSRDSYDVIILKKNIEVKIATEDVSLNFQFNGIRFERKFDYLFVLGIAPDDIYFNIFSKADVTTDKAGHLVPMEKGVAGNLKLTKSVRALYPISEFEKIMSSIIK